MLYRWLTSDPSELRLVKKCEFCSPRKLSFGKYVHLSLSSDESWAQLATNCGGEGADPELFLRLSVPFIDVQEVKVWPTIVLYPCHNWCTCTKKETARVFIYFLRFSSELHSQIYNCGALRLKTCNVYQSWCCFILFKKYVFKWCMSYKKR